MKKRFTSARFETAFVCFLDFSCVKNVGLRCSPCLAPFVLKNSSPSPYSEHTMHSHPFLEEEKKKKGRDSPTFHVINAQLDMNVHQWEL